MELKGEIPWTKEHPVSVSVVSTGTFVSLLVCLPFYHGISISTHSIYLSIYIYISVEEQQGVRHTVQPVWEGVPPVRLSGGRQKVGGSHQQRDRLPAQEIVLHRHGRRVQLRERYPRLVGTAAADRWWWWWWLTNRPTISKQVNKISNAIQQQIGPLCIYVQFSTSALPVSNEAY